jgi:hypothetical protein
MGLKKDEWQGNDVMMTTIKILLDLLVFKFHVIVI